MDPRETKIYTAVIIASIVLGIIIAYFTISLIRHQRRYAELTRRNILAEIAMLDKDRLRIASDLHDDLAPVLTAARYQVDSITIDTANKPFIEKAKSHIDYLSGRLREITKDLVPASLVSKGFVVSLQHFFENMEKSGIAISFEHHVRSSLPPETSINCYCMVQEIFQNTLKHSQAKRFIVQVVEKENTLTIICEDDGCGFNYQAKLSESSGLGLRNIRHRAEIMNSRFMAKSVPGKGTQYHIEIPMAL